jgi:hypothetical protein
LHPGVRLAVTGAQLAMIACQMNAQCGKAASEAASALSSSLGGVLSEDAQTEEEVAEGLSTDEGSATNGANDKGKEVEKDKKRFFDQGQKERARERSRDQDGDATCEYCGVKTTDQPGQPNSSQIDHVDAWSLGGRTSDENAVNSCRTCNGSKGKKVLGTEWLPGGVKP